MNGYEFERWRFRMNLTREEAATALCISYKEVCRLEAMDNLPECIRRAIHYFEQDQPPAMGPLSLPSRQRVTTH